MKQFVTATRQPDQQTIDRLPSADSGVVLGDELLNALQRRSDQFEWRDFRLRPEVVTPAGVLPEPAFLKPRTGGHTLARVTVANDH